MSDIYEFMKELNRKAAEELIKAYNKEKSLPGKIVEERIETDNNSSFPIRFPQYHNKSEQKPEDNIRVSEQELRFAMTSLFNKEVESSNLNYYFSVETPTVKKYRFSGTSEISAQTDMTIYDGTHQINIEFKAHNPKFESFKKDIEKLLRENVNECMWCHILKNADDGTWNSLFGKFKESFELVISNNKDVEKKTIYVSFLVLDKKMFYCKELTDINKYNDFFNDSIDTWGKMAF